MSDAEAQEEIIRLHELVTSFYASRDIVAIPKQAGFRNQRTQAVIVSTLSGGPHELVFSRSPDGSWGVQLPITDMHLNIEN